MSKAKVRYIIIITLLAITAVFILVYRNTGNISAADVDIFKIPHEIGEWKAETIPVEDKILDILETRSVLMREYTNDQGNVIQLTIVYYQGNRVELHLPERCSIGQGSFIVQRGRETVETAQGRDITANKLVVKSDKGNRVILYYFESGDFTTDRYYLLRFHMIMRKLKRKVNSGALVQFSSSIIRDPADTTDMLKKFIRKLGPMLPEYLP